jgi:DNA polymerase lambda
LKYFDDLQKRMPREEVTVIVEIVKNKIEELSEVKGTYEAICCGSYRRYQTILLN